MVLLQSIQKIIFCKQTRNLPNSLPVNQNVTQFVDFSEEMQRIVASFDDYVDCPSMLIYNMLKKLINYVGKSPMQKGQSQKPYVLFTYRSNIIKAMPTTYYDTDAGWGCMLRVAQMAIANLLYFYQGVPRKTILTLFWDNSDCPFSIQQFTSSTQKIFPSKKPFQWYNPSQMSFIIKDLVEQHFPYIHVKIFLDNSIFLDQIPHEHQKLLVIVLVRIGLQEPEEIYLPAIDSLMNNKYFFAALGGTPKHAHLFLKSANQQIGFLDPHKTLKAAKTQEQLFQRQAEYLGKLSWIKATKIDSSMGMIFRLGKEEIKSFWQDLQNLKHKHKQHFFLYMDQKRPEIQEDALIEICDFQ